MKIILNETWSIEGIPLNYVLKHKKISSGTGKNIGETRMVECDEGYYCTEIAALKGFSRKYLKEQTEDFNGNLDEYCNRVQNILDSAVEKMLKGVKTWEKG